jgi:hypothetical protein
MGQTGRETPTAGRPCLGNRAWDELQKVGEKHAGVAFSQRKNRE